MIALSHKSKQYGLIALKVLILSITFGYILLKVTGEDALSIKEFWTTLQSKNHFPILLFMGLAAANWIFEILKWQTVISALKKISFSEAGRQSLASLTVSLATPNRIGEYGAKAYFFEKPKRKQVLLLNLFSNLNQLAVTVMFGLIGLISLAENFASYISTTNVFLFVTAIIILGIAGYFFKEKQLLIKGLSIANVWSYFTKISLTIKLKTLALSTLRYLIFNSLFYLLLKYFGADIGFFTSAFVTWTMYLLSSIVPTVFIFDVVIKGGISVWLFSLVGVEEWPVLCTVLAMWLLNFVAPAIWGSFYVATYQPINK